MDEDEKLLHSVCRFIAGLRPRLGSTYYFSKRCLGEKTLSKLNALRELAKGKKCPFCGFQAKKVGCLVMHLLRNHRFEILDLLRSS